MIHIFVINHVSQKFVNYFLLLFFQFCLHITEIIIFQNLQCNKYLKLKPFAANVMEDYISSSEESSSSASSAGEDDIDDDEFPGHSQNSKGSSNHSGMQQSIIDQSSLYRCPFCCFQTTIEIVMREHLNFHFIKSVHQCQLCSFSIGTVPELYLHIQRHHLIADHSDIKV